MVNSEQISNFILKPIITEKKFNFARTLGEAYELIEKGIIYFSSQQRSDDLNKIISDILSGSSVLVFDELKKAIIFDTKGFEKRSVTEPSAENIVKGAKDSFVENFRVNTTNVRLKIKSQNLVIEETVIGTQTHTDIAIVYMDNIVDMNIVNNVRERLSKLKVDRILTSGFLEEALTDNIYSVFPQIRTTERPDSFCSDIIEGRVGIIIEGIPVTIIVPGTFIMFVQVSEDYSRNYIVASMIRILRYALIFATLTLPAFFVSITIFSPELIPTDLVLSIAQSKLGVPFPSFFETFVMLVAFEIIFEAGLRMPKNIGQSVTIVGALIVGEAAVNAKLISPAVVIVIAFTAIAGFTIPNQDLSNALRLWRFVLTFFASLLGLFGLVIGLILLVFHLCNIETYGVAYLSPFVSSKNNILDDTLFRFPLRSMKNRPEELKVKNKKRQE